MINLDSIINKKNKEYNKKWPYIPDHPSRILIIGGSGSGKKKTLNIQIQWMKFTRILMIIIRAEKEKI